MQHRFVQIGLTIAIAATFVALVAVGINVFVPHPDFDRASSACGEYCDARPIATPKTDTTMTPEEEAAQRQRDKEQRDCYDRAQADRHAFDQKVFGIAVVVGAVGVALGALIFPKFLPTAASGMTFGGLLTILYGMIRGLGAVDKRIMFVFVLAAFVLLLLVAWKRGRAMLGVK